jgi:hypothetical protein
MLLANQQVELNLCNQRFVITLGLTTGAGLLIKRGGELKLPAATENPTENPWVLRFDDVLST